MPAHLATTAIDEKSIAADTAWTVVRIMLIVAILIVMLYVAPSPTVIHGPTPRNVRYFLMAASLAILFPTCVAGG